MEKRRVLGEEVMEWRKRKMKREVFKENSGEVCHGVTTLLIIIVYLFFQLLTPNTPGFSILNAFLAQQPIVVLLSKKTITIGAGLGSDPWAWPGPAHYNLNFFRLPIAFTTTV